MAVKKYENGAFIKCTKDLNSEVTRCIDYETKEPFGRTNGEYDLAIFYTVDELTLYFWETESILRNGFCYDIISGTDRRTLICDSNKDMAESRYTGSKKVEKDIQKYF